MLMDDNEKFQAFMEGGSLTKIGLCLGDGSCNHDDLRVFMSWVSGTNAIVGLLAACSFTGGSVIAFEENQSAIGLSFPDQEDFEDWMNLCELFLNECRELGHHQLSNALCGAVREYANEE